MTRTTTRRRREMQHFVADNRRLFPFAALLLAGVGAGVAIYLATADVLPDALLTLSPVERGATAWLSALWESCFSTVVLLGILYLLGLWACGVPFILLVPLFYGVGLGMTEAYYYRVGGGGVWTVVVLVMPVGLLGAVVLAAACAESLRLSASLSRQLLPGTTEVGLWDGFRLYSLRFLLFLVAAVGVAVIEVLLRQAIL